MPESDSSHPPSSAGSPAEAGAERRNLPVPTAIPSQAPDETETWLGRILRVIFGWRPGSIRADLEVVLAGSPTETGFSPEESAMLKNILGLRERRIEDVMIPRADIVAVHQDIALGELVKVFEGAGHSRLVVYDDTLDDPVGMVHIRDLIAFMTARAAASSASKRKRSLHAGLNLTAIDLTMPLVETKIMRTMLFVPPSMPAIDLLAKMQATRIHLALVVDEYGGTDGLVSMEDIVEQIVGEIADEHDEDERPSVIAQADGSFLADARASIEDVVASVGAEFEVGELGNEVDTLGGYLMSQAGRVPVRGELVRGPGTFEIEVLDADPRRIKRVRIFRGKARRPPRLREPQRRLGADPSLIPSNVPPSASPEQPRDAPAGLPTNSDKPARPS